MIAIGTSHLWSYCDSKDEGSLPPDFHPLLFDTLTAISVTCVTPLEKSLEAPPRLNPSSATSPLIVGLGHSNNTRTRVAVRQHHAPRSSSAGLRQTKVRESDERSSVLP